MRMSWSIFGILIVLIMLIIVVVYKIKGKQKKHTQQQYTEPMHHTSQQKQQWNNDDTDKENDAITADLRDSISSAMFATDFNVNTDADGSKYNSDDDSTNDDDAANDDKEIDPAHEAKLRALKRARQELYGETVMDSLLYIDDDWDLDKLKDTLLLGTEFRDPDMNELFHVISDSFFAMASILEKRNLEVYHKAARKYLYMMYMALYPINDTYPDLPNYVMHFNNFSGASRFAGSDKDDVFDEEYEASATRYYALEKESKDLKEAISAYLHVVNREDTNFDPSIADAVSDEQTERLAWFATSIKSLQKDWQDCKDKHLTQETAINDSQYIEDAANIIVRYATPFIMYIKKNCSKTSSTLYGLYPLCFIAYFLYLNGYGNNCDLVFALQKVIETKVDYCELAGDATSYSTCNMMKLTWGGKIWPLFEEFCAKPESKDNPEGYLLVRILGNTAVKGTGNELEKVVTDMASSSLTGFENAVSVLKNKYGLN